MCLFDNWTKIGSSSSGVSIASAVVLSWAQTYMLCCSRPTFQYNMPLSTAMLSQSELTHTWWLWKKTYNIFYPWYKSQVTDDLPESLNQENWKVNEPISLTDDFTLHLYHAAIMVSKLHKDIRCMEFQEQLIDSLSLSTVC